jgi:lysophospholipase L1-like esterase
VTRPRTLLIALLCFLIISGAGAPALVAQSSQPASGPFAVEIRAFEEWDAKNTPPKHAVVFVGSSSIRMWPTSARFPNLTVINRGFGGSTIADVNRYVQETVLKYEPDVIVFYAGENDIATAKKTPQQVLGDFQSFTQRVHAAKPDTEIVFISLKPSPVRAAVWPQMVAANKLIKAYTASRPHLSYVDVVPAMLERNGDPRSSLFLADRLHMTPAGYDIWTDIVSRALTSLVKKTSSRR